MSKLPDINPVVMTLDLQPGTVLVVCQTGRLAVHVHASGDWCVDDWSGVSIYGADAATEAHKALLAEKYEERTEYGAPLMGRIETMQADIPPHMGALFKAARPGPDDGA